MEFFFCRSCQTHPSVAGQFQEEDLSDEHQNWGCRTSHGIGGIRIQPALKTLKRVNSGRFVVHSPVVCTCWKKKTRPMGPAGS